jgi:hypothetical protein
VVEDPTRQPDEPGEFLGRRFRICDVRQSAEDEVWPEGIVFHHLRDGTYLRYQSGALVQA